MNKFYFIESALFLNLNLRALIAFNTDYSDLFKWITKKTVLFSFEHNLNFSNQNTLLIFKFNYLNIEWISEP